MQTKVEIYKIGKIHTNGLPEPPLKTGTTFDNHIPHCMLSFNKNNPSSTMKFRRFAILTLLPFHLGAAELSLDLTCSIPAPLQTIQDASIMARLYEYDPRLADVAAKEVDRITVNGINLLSDRTTSVRLPLDAKRTDQRSYYVTIFVHPNAESEQRLYFINGFQKVFQAKDSEALEVTLKQKTR